MKFSELNDTVKIAQIKNSYTDIVERIHSVPKDIDKHLPDITNPKTPEEISAAETRKAEREAALKKIGTMQLRDKCICEPKCLEIDTDLIPEELEVLIDAARTVAEGKTY